MARITNAARLIALGAPALAASVIMACSSELVPQNDVGVPPAGGVYNPGNGYGGSPYGGYGSGAYTGGTGGSTQPPPPQPAVCPEERKRCEVVITTAALSETSLELRGDFRGIESWRTGIPMTKNGSQWQATVPVPLDTPVNYKFCMNPDARGECSGWRVDSTKPIVKDAEGNENNLLAGSTCATPVCDDRIDVPAGVFDWRDAIIYFAFVDRFFDSDGKRCATPSTSGPGSAYLGGDWKGMEEKIPYLKRLGINAVWLTVPAENTSAAGRGMGADDRMYSGYHGYWPSDLEAVENCFGSGEQTVAKSEQDLKSLVKALHANDIKVIIDYAMVHVHADSPLWRDHKDWFWGRDQGGCMCGTPGCDWNQFQMTCWFTDYLPHFNYTVKAARDFSVSNAMSWITRAAPPGESIDGFRLDAIKHVDDSWLTTLRSRVEQEVVAKMPKGSRFYMVGETFDYGRKTLTRYVDPKRRLDGQFDFPFRRDVIKSLLVRNASMADLGNSLMAAENGGDAYPADAIMSPFLGNHDIGRVIHTAVDNAEWDEYDNRPGTSDYAKAIAWNGLYGRDMLGQPQARSPYERLAAAFGVLFTNKGAPLIYYGDEVGLAGAGDPDNRRPMPFCGAANMQSAKATGRVCTKADGDPVWNEHQTWLFNRVAKLIEIRKAHPALRRGRLSIVPTGNEAGDVLAYSRQADRDTVYVVVNRSDAKKTVSVLPAGTWKDLLDGGTATGAVTVDPRSVRIFAQ